MDRDPQLRNQTILLGILVALAVVAALKLAQSVIQPFVLAVLLAYAAEPLVRGLARVRVPRWAGALMVVVLLFVATQAVIGIAASAAAELGDRLPFYQARIQQAIDAIPLPGDAPRIDLRSPELWRKLLPVGAVVSGVGPIAGALTAFFASSVLVLLLMVAVIIGRTTFDQRLDRITGVGDHDTAAVIDAIDVGIQRYLLLKGALSVGVGVTFGGVLWLYDLDGALLWGVLAFLLNFIPTVGPVLAVFPVMLLFLLQFGDQPSVVASGILVSGFVPFAFGNILEPVVFGERLDLNFLAVLFALVLWTYIWGVTGAVLSVPLTMAISLICREFQSLRPIHELLRA